MHLMPEDAFNRLKSRWVAFTIHLDNPKLMDPEIRAAVETLNRIDSVVTIFSCQGHPTETERGRGSLMFGVRDPAVVYRFYELLQQGFGLDSQAVKLVLQRKTDITNRASGDWYPVWIINWDIHLSDARYIWTRVNEAALQTAAEFPSPSYSTYLEAMDRGLEHPDWAWLGAKELHPDLEAYYKNMKPVEKE